MNVLLSIKPEFGEKILIEEKQYEFRKTTFREPASVERIVMYASSPLQKLIGWFSLSDVIEGSPKWLWQNFGPYSGISNRDRFMDYFSGTETGYAFEIENVVRLSNPVDPREALADFHPPVSFKYLNGEFDSVIK